MESSVYWYMGLTVVSLIIMIYICVRKRTSTALLQFLIMTQIAYLIETVIYVFLEAYEYKPHIIKHSAYFDSNLGALASNMLIVPILATLFAMFRLRWWWGLFFICALTGIEWLFLRLHIYAHHWWKLPYTGFGMIFYFWAAAIVYKRVVTPIKGWLHALYLFLATASILGTFHIIPIMFLENRRYLPGWFPDPDHDTTAFSSIYYVCSSILITLVVKIGWRSKWLNMALLTACYYGFTVALQKTGLLQIYAWWDPWYYALFPNVVYLMAEKISISLKRGA